MDVPGGNSHEALSDQLRLTEHPCDWRRRAGPGSLQP